MNVFYFILAVLLFMTTAAQAQSPLCIRDAPTSGPYHQLCLEATEQGGILSYNAFNGAPELPFICHINGVFTIPCGLGGGPPQPPQPGEMRAYDFTQKLGMNINNLGPENPPVLPQVWDRTAAFLNYIHVYNIRSGFTNDFFETPWQIERLATFAAQGVRMHLMFSPWGYPGMPVPQWIDWLKTHIVNPYGAGLITGVSGPNEADFEGGNIQYEGLTGIAAANRIQQEMFAAIKGDLSLAFIPVDMWPMAYPYATNLRQQVGNQTAHCDRNNLHDYYFADWTSHTFWAVPPGPIPTMLPLFLRDVKETCNRDAYITTESGWYTPNAAPGLSPHLGTSEYAQARLALYNWFDHAKDPNCKEFYAFTLFGGSADLSDPWYGIFHGPTITPFSPKLAATAIRNAMQILNDPGSGVDVGRRAPTSAAATFTPTTYTPSLSGMPEWGYNFVLAKSDGSYDVLVWREDNIWNLNTGVTPATGTPIPITPVNVTVTLPGNASGVIYNPTQSASSIASFSNTNTVQLALGDAPLIVEVHP